MYQEAAPSQPQQSNGMAITSLVASVLAWLLALLLACFNFVVLPLITIATLGAGGLLYICTGVVSLISPIGWLVAVITGNTAKKQIRATGAGGEGMATAGIISGYVGLGITVLILCGLGITFVIGLLGAATSSY
jgi:hypothetical protein